MLLVELFLVILKLILKLAAELSKTYFEVIIGNGYEKDAIRILKKRKNLRIIDSSKIKLENINSIVSNFNSLLIQSPDNKKFEK